MAVFVTTLHPNVLGRAFYWKKGKPVRTQEAPYSVMASENFRNSPAVAIMKNGTEIRRRLLEPDCPVDFPILEELKTEGVTDYIATPLDFTNVQNHAATHTSMEEGGFFRRRDRGDQSYPPSIDADRRGICTDPNGAQSAGCLFGSSVGDKGPARTDQAGRRRRHSRGDLVL